jgi:hypothetical protein
MESQMKYTHAIVHENGIEYALNPDHLTALLLEGMAIGWENPIIIPFDEPITMDEAKELLEKAQIQY